MTAPPTDTQKLFCINVDAALSAPVVERVSQRANEIRQSRTTNHSSAEPVSVHLPDLSRLSADSEGISSYIEALRDNVYVDINDFDIQERRRRFSRVLVTIKRCLWSILRFYTYRLWSQQNQINGIQLASLDALHGYYSERIKSLEKRLAALEMSQETETLSS